MPKKIHRKYRPSDSRYDSAFEEKFHKLYLEAAGSELPFPTVHHRVNLTQNWEIDFAFVPQRIAIELQGWGTGHLSYKGVLRDQQKHNDLILDGWLVLYFMSYHVDNPEGRKIMLRTLFKALEIKGARQSNTDIQKDRECRSSPLINLARRRGN